MVIKQVLNSLNYNLFKKLLPFCSYSILSIPFCPYHFLQYHFLHIPFCPYHFVHTIFSNTIFSIYHFVHTISSIPFCPIPFCPITLQCHKSSLQLQLKQN